MENDRDSHNNIGSELLINPKRKNSGAVSSASSVMSMGKGSGVAPVPTATDRSTTVGNIMGSRRSVRGGGGDRSSVGTAADDLEDDAISEIVSRRSGRSFAADPPPHSSKYLGNGGGGGGALSSHRSFIVRGGNNDGGGRPAAPHYRHEKRARTPPSERSYRSMTTASGGGPLSHHYSQRHAKRAAPRIMTEEEIRLAKQDILHAFHNLEVNKGYRMMRKFSLDSSLEEMQAELNRIQKDKSVCNSVKFQRNFLMMCVNSVEYLNNRFDPFNIELEGWSMSVSDSLEKDYDEIFEKLHEKYGGTSNMAPELQLMFTLGGSAMMFHIENKLYKKMSSSFGGGGGAEQPSHQQASRKPTTSGGGGGGGGGGIMGMIGNLFGGMGGAGNTNNNNGGNRSPPPPPQQRRPRERYDDEDEVVLKGPMNDDILREIQQNAFRQDNNERIEMVSNGGGDSDIDEIRDEAGMSMFTEATDNLARDDVQQQQTQSTINPSSTTRARRGGGGTTGGRGKGGKRGGAAGGAAGGGRTLVM